MCDWYQHEQKPNTWWEFHAALENDENSLISLTLQTHSRNRTEWNQEQIQSLILSCRDICTKRTLQQETCCSTAQNPNPEFCTFSHLNKHLTMIVTSQIYLYLTCSHLFSIIFILNYKLGFVSWKTSRYTFVSQLLLIYLDCHECWAENKLFTSPGLCSHKIKRRLPVLLR